MRRFLLMTKRGTYPPRFIHQGIESAITEATRLSESLKDDVTILEIVGEVKQVEVPVTRTETKVSLKEGIYNGDDDLPF
jgi:hypothetical protein